MFFCNRSKALFTFFSASLAFFFSVLKFSTRPVLSRKPHKTMSSLLWTPPAWKVLTWLTLSSSNLLIRAASLQNLLYEWCLPEVCSTWQRYFCSPGFHSTNFSYIYSYTCVFTFIFMILWLVSVLPTTSL